MKKFFKYILVSLLPAYLIASLVFYASAHDEQKCSRIEITLLDSTDTHFTSVQEIKKQIKSIRVISRKAIPDFQKDNPNPKGKRRQVQKGNVM